MQTTISPSLPGKVGLKEYPGALATSLPAAMRPFSNSKGPESAQGVGLVILFPLPIVSNALVPTERMPQVSRVITEGNPVSAVTSACRQLFSNPDPSIAIHSWPMQHPIVASLVWSSGFTAVFAPLASFLFRRRTTG